MHGIIGLAALLFVSSAIAQFPSPDGHIVHCKKGKQVSIQNVPCEPGWTQTKGYGYYAPTDTERAKRERERIRQEMDERYAAMKQPSWSRDMLRIMDEKDCQNARAYRDRQRAEIGSQRLTRAKEAELCRIEEHACGWCRW